MGLFTIGSATEYADGSSFTTLAVINNGSNCYSIPSTGAWRCVLNLAGGMLVSVPDPPATAPRSVTRVRVEQDATGGRTLEIAPSTIAWRSGSPPTIGSAASAFIQFRLTWLGAAFGWFGEPLP